jgi:hypothetical protein
VILGTASANQPRTADRWWRAPRLTPTRYESSDHPPAGSDSRAHGYRCAEALQPHDFLLATCADKAVWGCSFGGERCSSLVRRTSGFEIKIGVQVLVRTQGYTLCSTSTSRVRRAVATRAALANLVIARSSAVAPRSPAAVHIPGRSARMSQANAAQRRKNGLSDRPAPARAAARPAGSSRLQVAAQSGP